VLLLNSTYEPLTALPVRRAIIMLICGKADVVHDDPSGPVIHSTTRSIAVPSVIRLRTFVRVPYRARVPMTRAALMHRDRFCCAYCGAKADTVDHVVPRSRGGDHSWENCVACCSTCNHRKGDKLLTQGPALAAAVDGQRTRPVLGAISRRRRRVALGSPVGYGLRRELDGNPPVFLGHPVVAGDRAGGADLEA
jgi:5-methylcytosine-specific restriction endonuclease McrA